MRGGGEIGQRHYIARQPAAVVQQPRHVVEVIFDRLGPGLDVLAVRVALFGDLLVDPLFFLFFTSNFLYKGSRV